MKKFVPALLFACCLLALGLSAFAAEKPGAEQSRAEAPVYTIRVGLEQLSWTSAPCPASPIWRATC